MPSATFQKFNCTVQDLGNGLHDFSTAVLKVYLTNTLPVATNTVYGTPADLSTGGGYTAGGATVPNTAFSQSSGVASLTGGNVTFTATTGFGPFRYAVLYNSSASTQNLIGWFDYGAAISPGGSESFVVAWGSSIATWQ